MRTLAGAALGTGWRVRFVAHGGDRDAARRDAIEARLAAIVAAMSQWEPASALSRFNAAPAGRWMSLPPDLASVVACALAIAEWTDGAFDPTLGRVAALLGFGAMPVAAPADAAALAEAMREAGWRRLCFDPGARRLRQPGGLWLDLSGIGKGYAVDAVARVLRDDGVAAGLVEIGGELVGWGVKPDGEPWWVDVETPPDCSAVPLRLALCGQAVATSGDYVRGAHTIDPATGRSPGAAVASVSVVHADAMRADAWATAFAVLGPDQAVAMADAKEIAMRMLLRRDGGTEERLSRVMQAMLA